MLRTLVALVGLLAASVATAQVKTPDQIVSDIASTMPSNSRAGITAATVRARLNDILAYVQNASAAKSVVDFGAKGYPTNDTLAFQAALDWVVAAPGRAISAPPGQYMVDGLDLNGCLRCRVDFSSATLEWSGTTKAFSDATGITYPQSVFLIRGDWSLNQGGTIQIGRLDGFNMASDGLFVSAAYAHRIAVGSIYYTRYAVNYSPHMNYASETTVSVGLINRTKRGIYEAPDYLYRDFSPPKTNLYFYSHLTENAKFDIGIIVNCIDYGIKRDAPTSSGSNQTGSNAINTFNVGAVDCTDYYDRTVDPIGGATPGDYKGGTPIANPPAGETMLSGRTRPDGILLKPPSDQGAIDIRDDYDSLTTPTPVTSRSTYQTTFLGNSAAWLAGPTHGGAGLGRSNLQILIQDYTKFGGVNIDGYNKVIASSGDVNLRAGSGGTLSFNFPTSLTVGTFGTAAAPPATPNRYLTIKDENGNLLKIPAYNP
jgi:hypothetical protein